VPRSVPVARSRAASARRVAELRQNQLDEPQIRPHPVYFVTYGPFSSRAEASRGGRRVLEKLAEQGYPESRSEVFGAGGAWFAGITRRKTMNALLENRRMTRRQALAKAYPGRDTGGWDVSAPDPKVDRILRQARRDNPLDCPSCYQENQLGGAMTALLIAALVGWLIFARRSPIASAAAAPAPVPATCVIDVQKLDQWGNARGFPVFYLLRTTTPPTHEELLVAFPTIEGFTSDTQVVIVLADGSFWYYLDPDNVPAGFSSKGRADNLRADYCAFAAQPATVQGIVNWL
jgi:hypothetical protein